MNQTHPTIRLERELYGQGFRYIAGVDEVGRGPLAGPVVAAAVIFPPRFWAEEVPSQLLTLKDSKLMTPRGRERLYSLIVSIPDVEIGIGLCSHRVIDEIGIVEATGRAMIRAIERLTVKPDFILIDGKRLPHFSNPACFIVKGDRLCFTIAAASVVAKVIRDRIMIRFDKIYSGYGFAQHKGYPTIQHLKALSRLGPSPIHRYRFAPIAALPKSRPPR